MALVPFLLSIGLVSQTVYAVDSCRDAFGAPDLLESAAGSGVESALGANPILRIRSGSEADQVEATRSLQQVNEFLAGSGLLTPKMLNFEVAASSSSDANFSLSSAAIRMRTEFAKLAPLESHAAFIHEYGHAVFEYSALRDSSVYRGLARKRARFQKLLQNYKSLQAELDRAAEEKNFDRTSELRKPMKAALAEFEAYSKVNLLDAKRLDFGIVFQEAFADLLPIFYLRDPKVLAKFASSFLRVHDDESISPDHWMETDFHYALVPFVRHAIQKTMIEGEISPPQASQLIHRLMLRKIEMAANDPAFSMEAREINKIRREAFIYGHQVSDLNRDLISEFDSAISAQGR